jgi:hypothetical protein
VGDYVYETTTSNLLTLRSTTERGKREVRKKMGNGNMSKQEVLGRNNSLLHGTDCREKKNMGDRRASR